MAPRDRLEDPAARTLARVTGRPAADGPRSAAERLRSGARDLARRAVGTVDASGLAVRLASLQAQTGEYAFAQREQAERADRQAALSDDLTATLRRLHGSPPRPVDRADAGDAPSPRPITIITPAMLPRVRLLAASLRRHAPSWPPLRTIVVGAAGGAVSNEDAISVIELLELDPERLLVEHPWPELLALLVPRALLATSATEPGPVIHLPVGTWVLADPTPLADALTRHPVLLAARLAGEPEDDGLEPSAQSLQSDGRVDPHLIGVDGSTAAGAFLRWWSQRLEVVTGEPGLGPGHRRDARTTVMRSLELAALWPEVTTLTDPALRLTAHNALERPLRKDGETLLAGERPVRMIDLPGFDPTRPFRLDDRSSRVRLSTLAPLAQLAWDHASELLDAGWDDAGHAAAIGRQLPGGRTFDADLQSQYVIAQALGAATGDPFTAEGGEAFERWLRGPAPRGGGRGVTRHLQFKVARHRRDVAIAFPDLDGSDGEALLAWAREQGIAELGLDASLTEPLAVPVEAGGGLPAPPPRSPCDPPRARVSGYMGHVLGLGAAARGYAEALAAAGVDVRTRSVSLDRLRPAVDQGEEYGSHGFALRDDAGTPDAEIVCVNPGELEALVDLTGPGGLVRPRIGVWGWETDTVPSNWAPAHAFVDEVWVYSRFVADNLARLTDRPIAVLPPPVPIPSPAVSQRLGVGDGFLFLFAFDYSSTIQRKNPVGLIEAFTCAFAPGEGPQLLIKTINARLLPLAHEEVLWAARDRPDVHVVDRSLSDAERDGLIAACDCYVSLHRSEGFGLTMAEAMAIGKPVIATGYSGNVDFMTADNSLLVDYSLTHVGPDAAIYPADGTWAQPSLAHAAALMRRVHDEPGTAAGLGARAREDIARTLSAGATGDAMRRRLEQVIARGCSGDA